MKVVFVGVFYFKSPVRYLYNIFEKYKKIAKVFETVGIDCFYFAKQNEILPGEKTLTEEQFYKMLPEIDLLFMWNGSLAPEKEITVKCREQGTPIYFMELGWLPQTNTFYFDTKGINYESSLTDWKYKPLNDEDIFYVNSKLAYHKTVIVEKKNVELPQEFVFVPLQVENDSQIRQHSPRFKTMQSLISYVAKYVPEHLIIKKHPKGTYGDLVVPAKSEIRSEGTVYDYIEKCKYVITINSTVGIESLVYNKPVITLGNAFYGGRGITFNAKDDNEFCEAVKWAREGKVALGVIQSFLHFLYKKQWHVKELDDPNRVLTLIKGLTD